MRHTVGFGTSLRTPLLPALGRGRIRCKVAYDALLSPLDPADEAANEVLSDTPARPAVALVRPSTVTPERPSTGRVTPSKVAGLSAVLRLPATRVESILQRSPTAVHSLEPQDVAKRLQELSSVLGLRPKHAAFMVTKQPGYLLLQPMEAIQAKIRELAAALRVPQAAVLRAAVTVPSILVRKTNTILRRAEAYSALLQCSNLDVLHVMARGPEFLSDTPSSIKKRMTALGYVVRRPKHTIAEMVKARPDLMCISQRVMNSKVNGLMCILQKEKRHIVTLVVKAPALMRCDLDTVRHAFEGTQFMLRKKSGFVYAMVCHAPYLLLLTPHSLRQRCAALRRCLAASVDWQQQFPQVRPPGVAQIVLNRRGCLSVMMYLTERRRAGVVPLQQLVDPEPAGGPRQALGPLWPDFLAWMEQRRRHVAVVARQQRAMMAGAGQHMPGQAPPPALSQPMQRPDLGLAARPLELSTAGAHVQAHTGVEIAGPRAPPPLPQHATHHLPQQPGGNQLGPAVRGPAWQAQVGLPAVARAAAAAAACSNSRSHSSSSTSSVSSRSAELEGQASSGQGPALDRQQQPGASTSGRQPSWLQLRAEFGRLRQQERQAKEAVQLAQQAERAALRAAVRRARPWPRWKLTRRRPKHSTEAPVASASGEQASTAAQPKPQAVQQATVPGATVLPPWRFTRRRVRRDKGMPALSAPGQPRPPEAPEQLSSSQARTPAVVLGQKPAMVHSSAAVESAPAAMRFSEYVLSAGAADLGVSLIPGGSSTPRCGLQDAPLDSSPAAAARQGTAGSATASGQPLLATSKPSTAQRHMLAGLLSHETRRQRGQSRRGSKRHSFRGARPGGDAPQADTGPPALLSYVTAGAVAGAMSPSATALGSVPNEPSLQAHTVLLGALAAAGAAPNAPQTGSAGNGHTVNRETAPDVRFATATGIRHHVGLRPDLDARAYGNGNGGASTHGKVGLEPAQPQEATLVVVRGPMGKHHLLEDQEGPSGSVVVVGESGDGHDSQAVHLGREARPRGFQVPRGFGVRECSTVMGADQGHVLEPAVGAALPR